MTEKLKLRPYWENLTESEKQLAGRAAYVRHYEPGERLYGPDVECVGMIHILTGETRAYILSDEGRDVTLFRVRCFAYELATRRFSSVVSVMEQTLFARLDKRLAGFLLRTYRETKNPEICMTQEKLAVQVNSVRETVGRMLKRFAEDGMIENRRGSVLLTDIRKLEEMAK